MTKLRMLAWDSTLTSMSASSVDIARTYAKKSGFYEKSLVSSPEIDSETGFLATPWRKSCIALQHVPTKRGETVMGVASRYWRLVTIDATGGCKVEAIDSLAAFFGQEFAEFAGGGEVQDAFIQRRLLDLLHNDTHLCVLAEGCLRCFISNQIEQVCIQLEEQFGREHGFTRYDLFSFVLDDVDVAVLHQRGSLRQGAYKSLATEILQTFNPERGNLSTWATQLTKHHPELNAFLLERGVYLVSDWAILNDTTPKQVQRIFSEFHHSTPLEIQQACILLESYHLVYRRDRLKLRQSGGGGKCQPPTDKQLEQIAQSLVAKLSQENQAILDLSTEDILTRLQDMAGKLRQYRISVRRGTPQTDSIDDPEIRPQAENNPSPKSENEETDEQEEFLEFYQASFLECLDLALDKVVSDRVANLQRKKPPTDRQFLQALHLFHCQAKAMGEIALAIGFQAQYQVTRLLKLKEFRADVRQKMLESLRDRILNQAKIYVDPERLQSLDSQVELALDERISEVIQDATDEASNPNRSAKSRFAQRLCKQLKGIFDF